MFARVPDKRNDRGREEQERAGSALDCDNLENVATTASTAACTTMEAAASGHTTTYEGERTLLAGIAMASR